MPITPVFIATWKFGQEACNVGLRLLLQDESALDAVEQGANAVEENPIGELRGFWRAAECRGRRRVGRGHHGTERLTARGRWAR